MYKMNLALAFSIQNSITDSSGILQVILKEDNKLWIYKHKTLSLALQC